jgi:cold shock CspA family protein
MKDGRIAELDPQTGKGYIETSGSRVIVYVDDIVDDEAKHEGAIVQFDLEREPDQDKAVNVTLREGTRHNTNQRRFGDTG